jgi:hypothetical protein
MSIARTFAVLRFSRLALSRAFPMLTLVDNRGTRVLVLRAVGRDLDDARRARSWR